jgi:hypothetical protein
MYVVLKICTLVKYIGTTWYFFNFSETIEFEISKVKKLAYLELMPGSVATDPSPGFQGMVQIQNRVLIFFYKSYNQQNGTVLSLNISLGSKPCVCYGVIFVRKNIKSLLKKYLIGCS